MQKMVLHAKWELWRSGGADERSGKRGPTEGVIHNVFFCFRSRRNRGAKSRGWTGKNVQIMQ